MLKYKFNIADITPGASQNDFSNILSHRNDLSAITASSMYGWNPPQPPPPPPPPYQHAILPEPMPLLKNLQNFSDEIYNAIFGDEVPPMIDHSAVADYNSHLKLTDFEDDTESMFMSQGGYRWDFWK